MALAGNTSAECAAAPIADTTRLSGEHNDLNALTLAIPRVADLFHPTAE
jgi:hypothetical protein